MAKKQRKQVKRNARRAATVIETAELVGVTPRAVQMVLSGDRRNEGVLSIFMEIDERHNALLREVKKLVPFTLNNN